jgi:hypothetical protein
VRLPCDPSSTTPILQLRDGVRGELRRATHRDMEGMTQNTSGG